MTIEELYEAVEDARAFCIASEDEYRNNKGPYESYSLRKVLTKIGYSHSEIDEVIHFVAERGFDYCVDPIITARHSDGPTPAFACVWGIDQLRSRLDCVR